MNHTRQTIQLEKLHRLSQTVMQLQDIPRLAEAVSHMMEDYSHTWVGIVENQQVVYSYDENHRLEVRGKGLIGWVAAHGEPLFVNHVDKDARYLRIGDQIDPTCSELVVTIKKDDQVLGVLDLHADTHDAFSEGDLQFAESLAQVLSVAIQNACLYEDSRIQAERLSLVA